MVKRELTVAAIESRVREWQEEEWDGRWKALRKQILADFESYELDDRTGERLEEMQESEVESLRERIVEERERWAVAGGAR